MPKIMAILPLFGLYAVWKIRAPWDESLFYAILYSLWTYVILTGKLKS